MIGNVQIVKNNGESLISNGLAHFSVIENGNQYIIYSLGEEVNNLMKIYVARENINNVEEVMTDEESAFLTDLLKKVSKNEGVSNIIGFLPLNSDLYKVQDKVKKIALPRSAFNNIIDVQQKSQIKENSENSSVIEENQFFADLNPEKSVVQSQMEEKSIFENPILPEQTEDDLLSENTSSVIEVKTHEDGNNVLNTNDAIISDEQAKQAIDNILEAKKILEDNSKLLEKYINQQKNIDNQQKTTSDLAIDIQPMETTDTLIEEKSLPKDLSDLSAIGGIEHTNQVVLDNLSNIPNGPQEQLVDIDNPQIIDTSIGGINGTNELNTDSAIIDTLNPNGSFGDVSALEESPITNNFVNDDNSGGESYDVSSSDSYDIETGNSSVQADINDETQLASSGDEVILPTDQPPIYQSLVLTPAAFGMNDGQKVA